MVQVIMDNILIEYISDYYKDLCTSYHNARNEDNKLTKKVDYGDLIILVEALMEKNGLKYNPVVGQFTRDDE